MRSVYRVLRSEDTFGASSNVNLATKESNIYLIGGGVGNINIYYCNMALQ